MQDADHKYNLERFGVGTDGPRPTKPNSGTTMYFPRCCASRLPHSQVWLPLLFCAPHEQPLLRALRTKKSWVEEILVECTRTSSEKVTTKSTREGRGENTVRPELTCGLLSGFSALVAQDDLGKQCSSSRRAECTGGWRPSRIQTRAWVPEWNPCGCKICPRKTRCPFLYTSL